MVDNSTVLIAAISAGAGLAGSVVVGHFSLRGLGLAHRREDAAAIRMKAEELYGELDRLQAQGGVVSVHALVAMQTKQGSPDQFPPLDLGKMRALAGLYFPECLPPVREYDAFVMENARALRAEIKKGDVDQLIAGFGYVAADAQAVVMMCRQVRAKLDAQVGSLGESVRNSVRTRRLYGLLARVLNRLLRSN
jgi:hypothetical protein